MRLVTPCQAVVARSPAHALVGLSVCGGAVLQWHSSPVPTGRAEGVLGVVVRTARRALHHYHLQGQQSSSNFKLESEEPLYCLITTTVTLPVRPHPHRRVRTEPQLPNRGGRPSPGGRLD